MKNLLSEWISNKVPIFNGIMQADGHVFHVHAIDPPRTLPCVLSIDEESEVSFELYADWTAVFPVAKETSQETGAVAVVGECGMGGDGFVALQKDESPQSLVWIAFFDFSNPFEFVRFDENSLIASNSLGEEWVFSLSEVREIVIRGTTRGVRGPN